MRSMWINGNCIRRNSDGKHFNVWHPMIGWWLLKVSEEEAWSRAATTRVGEAFQMNVQLGPEYFAADDSTYLTPPPSSCPRD